MKKSIYDLELHEETSFPGCNIMRVPGGWLYSSWDYDKEHFMIPVFVPFNNEFQ